MASETPASQSHPKRVLITGGAGFIGSHLVDQHRAMGDEIVVIDNCSTGRAQNLDHHAGAIELISADLNTGLAELASRSGDAKSKTGGYFDLIYHLAAAVGVDLVLADPIGSIRTNIMQTDALLEFAVKHGSPATFMASTSEVYGKPGVAVFSEEDDSVYGPTSITRWSYAHTKAIDEYLSMGYMKQYGLPVVVGRFFNTVGPRQIGNYGMVLPRFVQAAMAGEPLRVFGDGKQSRCFCDVRDVVDALPRMLACEAAHGQVMNIGSDRSISIIDLANLVIRELGSKSEIELVEYSDAYPAGFEDLRHRKPDLSKLRSFIGFEHEFTLEQTIKDMALHFSKASGGAAC